LILASDGIFNEGSNPLYGVKKIGAPVFTVALGDTTAQVDLILKRVLHNNIAYLGDKFSIQIDVSARNLAGKNTSLEISKLNNSAPTVLKRVNLRINKGDYFHTEEVVLDANVAGVQRYRVRLLPTAGEATTANNSKDFYIDVLDARQKILILADSPNPDISAIRQSLGSNKNYEIEVAYGKSPPNDLAKYSFAILHQLPSKKFAVSNVLKQLKNSKTPHLFIAGNNSNIPALNAAQPLVNIKATGDNSNNVTPILGNNFNLFTLGEDLISNIKKYPPLSVPFGDFDGSSIGETLLLQEIKKVETQYPLLSIGEESGTKVGLLCGEGIWRWRLFDFLSNENHDTFDELFSKVVQYLSVKEDKRKFRVSIPKNIFKENEEVILDGELYNSSYELINTPEASVTIKSASGKEYNYTFSKTQNAYTLNAGILPVGNYSFTAQTTFTGEKHNYKGQFSVQPIQLELYNTTADHKLLNLLSDEFGGKTLSPSEIPKLAQQLKDNPALKPIIYQTTTTKSVMDLKWIALLILFLFSLEWFLRRYFGTY